MNRTFKEFQVGDRVTFRKHEGTIVETFRDNGYPGYWVEFSNGSRFPYGANALTRVVLPVQPVPKPLMGVIERAIAASKDTTSGEIWGQEDGLESDRDNHIPQQPEPTLEVKETGELIRVVNVHKLAGKLPNLIVAMKSKGHPLGNPFYREAKSDRAGCIRKFKKWLWEQYQIEGSAVRAEIEAIADLVMAGEQVNLGCCCKQPDVFVACHCDEIKALVENYVIPHRLEVAA